MSAWTGSRVSASVLTGWLYALSLLELAAVVEYKGSIPQVCFWISATLCLALCCIVLGWPGAIRNVLAAAYLLGFLLLSVRAVDRICPDIDRGLGLSRGLKHALQLVPVKVFEQFDRNRAMRLGPLLEVFDRILESFVWVTSPALLFWLAFRPKPSDLPRARGALSVVVLLSVIVASFGEAYVPVMLSVYRRGSTISRRGG